MATDVAPLSRQRQVAAKVETTTGTEISLAGADTIPLFYDALIENNTEYDERPAQASLSRLVGVIGQTPAKFTGNCELMGSGTTTLPTWATTLLLACGFQNSSGTFTPLTQNPTTLTMAVLRPTGTEKMVGAMGNLNIQARAGKVAKLNWDFLGVWGGTATYSELAQTLPAIQPPRVVSIAMTIGGASYRIGEVGINLNNTLKLREDVNAAGGLHSCCITDRRIVVSVNPESPAIATIDWHAVFAAGTTAALSMQIGSASHNTITITAPNLALSAPPKGADDGGIWKKNLEFECTAALSVGVLQDDSELSIAFT